MERIFVDAFHTAAGKLSIAVDEAGRLRRCSFVEDAALEDNAARTVLVPDAGVCAPARMQILEYFAGRRRSFDLELAPEGTEFQRSVWRSLERIPWGETRSYGELAAAVGSPRAVRAVGGANGANPIAIVIPCHRVIAANGSLGGYSAGTDRKRVLLALEGRLLFS